MLSPAYLIKDLAEHSTPVQPPSASAAADDLYLVSGVEMPCLTLPVTTGRAR